MALLNTAYVLASWGRNVLIVDMDLEAPGVGGLLTRLGELSPPPAQDLFDLLYYPMNAVVPISCSQRTPFAARRLFTALVCTMKAFQQLVA